MSGNKIVKLVIYRHLNEEIIIDTVPAKDWGDFVVVSMDLSNISEETYNLLQETFGEYSRKMNKEVILMPSNLDIEFYGIEKEEDDRSVCD